MGKGEPRKTAAIGVRERTRSSFMLHEWYLVLAFEFPLLAESEDISVPGAVQQRFAEYELAPWENA